MAKTQAGNPQTENGYTKIADELLEEIIKTKLPNYEYRVFLAILRKTYGFEKKLDWISLSQIKKITNIKIPHICRAINKLLEKNMIIKNGRLKGINKKYKEWKLPSRALPRQAVPGKVTQITSLGNKTLPGQADTKDIETLLQKGEKKIFDKESEEYKLSFHLLKKLKEHYSGFKKPDLQKWAEHIDKMIRLDKKDPKEIKQMIDWCQASDFWFPNIKSTGKLREQFDNLVLRSMAGKGGSKNESTLRA